MEISISFLSHASSILADTEEGLRASQIVKLCSSFAIEHNVDIPYTKTPLDAPNKRTALLENLQCFKPEQQYALLSELCSIGGQQDREAVTKLKRQLSTRYHKLDADGAGFDKALVKETTHWLSDYPDALKQYESAIEKRESGIYNRNLLDDLRLSLELLLKAVFKNDKSLENQIGYLGEFVKGLGGSVEYRNMFVKLIEYYCKFQNEHVKHNDMVSGVEIDFIVDITSAFMRTIVRCTTQ